MAIDFDDAEDAMDAEVAPSMNTTPLIDVLLVLLVMLIITIPIQLHSVRMDLPAGLPPADAPVPVVVKLEVAVDSMITWNGEAVADQADLQARLQAAAQQPEQPEFHVHANAKTPYDTVAAVLTAAQKHGLMKIGVVGLDEYATPVSAVSTNTP
ncbi:MAG: biopolymer transporter ExbD [Rhodoferax sp.]|nr:biopolymer transporter ExbD [Rhodoferax sp.]